MMRWLTIIWLSGALAACSVVSPETLDTIEENATATLASDAAVDAAEDTTFSTVYEMTASYIFSLPWGTELTLQYPAEDGWSLASGTRLTLFSPDGYNFLIGGSDNPQNIRDARMALDDINQTAPIETIQFNGNTVYISEIQSGNALAATMDIAENKYILVQMLSRFSDDLDEKRDFLAQLVASIQVTANSEDSD